MIENESNYSSNEEHTSEDEIYVDEIIEQIDANNNNRRIPLYPGCPVSIYDACTRLVKLIQLLDLDKEKTRILLKELRYFFPKNSYLPKTAIKLFQITQNDYIPQV